MPLYSSVQFIPPAYDGGVFYDGFYYPFTPMTSSNQFQLNPNYQLISLHGANMYYAQPAQYQPQFQSTSNASWPQLKWPLMPVSNYHFYFHSCFIY